MAAEPPKDEDEPPKKGAGNAVSNDVPVISSPDDLRKWLSDKPKEWAQIIAVRLALRVFPHILGPVNDNNDSRKLGLTLQIWRANFISSVASTYPTDEMMANAARAARAADAADAANAAANAARAAADAAAATNSADAATFAIYLANEAIRSNYAVDSGVNSLRRADVEIARFWRAVNFDVGFLPEFGSDKSSANALADMPLWPVDIEGVGATDPSIPDWARTKLDSFERQAWEEKSSWKLIADWYRALLPDPPDQKPHQYLGETASLAIATQPDEFWTVSEERTPDIIMDDVVRVARESGAAWDPVGGVIFSEGKGGTAVNLDVFNTDLTDDQPEGDVDHLGRADIAFMLANRMQQVWDMQARSDDGEPSPSFVVHIDAPWGGGKSTFANYLTRILNPHLNGPEIEEWKKDLPQKQLGKWRDNTPWHVVWYNAWQKQHVRPPWWTFYNGFLKDTLKLVLRGRFRRKFTTDKHLPGDERDLFNRMNNLAFWVIAWLREGVWRLFAPGNRIRVVIALISLLSFLGLWKAGLLELAKPDGEDEGGWRWAGDAAGLVAIATFAWSTFSAFAKSLFIGTPDAANNYSLGAEDPHQHFKKHYNKYCVRLGRPILIVVDDLDRCNPDFVTELLSGFQTVLASPRVVILLLGDRDWLEESFAQSNKTMKEIDVGPEHSFGGRFVEKVIQLSITLPKIDDKTRHKYLRALLDVEEDENVSQPEPVRTAMAGVREALANSTPDLREASVFAAAETAADQNPEIDRAVLLQEAARAVAIESSMDADRDTRTKHQLQGMAYVLPPNPRQIKRIVNTVALIAGVALAENQIREGTPEWRKLARWVVLMIEWPQTWYTLSNNPEIAAHLDSNWEKIDPGKDKILQWAKMISTTEQTHDLLLFKLDEDNTDWPLGEAITRDDIEIFAKIMPATSGSMLELPKPKKKPETEDDA